jgi:hypothetical protein
MQLLKSHAKTTMPLKGMWSKLMKLKNISIVAMYLHRKQRGIISGRYSLIISYLLKIMKLLG